LKLTSPLGRPYNYGRQKGALPALELFVAPLKSYVESLKNFCLYSEWICDPSTPSPLPIDTHTHRNYSYDALEPVRDFTVSLWLSSVSPGMTWVIATVFRRKNVAQKTSPAADDNKIRGNGCKLGDRLVLHIGNSTSSFAGKCLRGSGVRRGGSMSRLTDASEFANRFQMRGNRSVAFSPFSSKLQ